MVEELRDCLDAIPRGTQSTNVTRSWTERREQLDQSWEAYRSKLFEDVMASMALPSETVCVLCTVQCNTFSGWYHKLLLYLKYVVLCVGGSKQKSVLYSYNTY